MNLESPTWYKEAEPKEQKLFREWLQGVLKTDIVNLTFVKKDDTIRKMKRKNSKNTRQKKPRQIPSKLPLGTPVGSGISGGTLVVGPSGQVIEKK